MNRNSLNSFVDLIRQQFSEYEHVLINENTDIKLLKEWSSLQTMIIVNEVDKAYGVILEVEDFKSANNLTELFHRLQLKQN